MGFFTFWAVFTMPVFRVCSAVFTAIEHGVSRCVQGVFTALLCSFSLNTGMEKA